MNNKPLIIAGPCSAESEEQVISTAEALVASKKVDIFRAGAWKPRTIPNTFEGLGDRALPWLAKVRAKFGIPIATEVANTQHVEQALLYDIDVLWIGARTTTNPFSMQEVAEALRGTNKKIYVKNPISPDIGLWVGGVERLLSCNVTNIGLIHRGFSSYCISKLRNAPMWNLALEMRRLMPKTQMICDPSHICGCREYISDISQQAIDLNFDGLMIESHIAPDVALSDAKQQLTPTALIEILDNLKWYKGNNDSQYIHSLLMSLREQIDTIDNNVLQLLSERMKVAEQIGLIKRDNDIRILQESRWEDVVRRTFCNGETLGLSRDFLKTLLDAVHIESIEHQKMDKDIN